MYVYVCYCIMQLDMYEIQPVIFGDACECDNFECEIRNGIICSGMCATLES